MKHKTKQQNKKHKSSKKDHNRKWHIVHIVDPANLPYSSLDDENFKKAWALANLKPEEIKGPPKQMQAISKEQLEVNKQFYALLLADLKFAKENKCNADEIGTMEGLMDLVKRSICLAPVRDQN